MCTIRRARIRKLIKYQRKGKQQNNLIILDLNCFPEREFDKSKWEEALKLLNTKGVVFHEYKPPAVKRIKSRIL